MDWIRRNWPDFLIGLALLAVIAGIIATLLNGGSFFPFGQSSTSSEPGVSAPQNTTTTADDLEGEPATEADNAPADGATVTPIAPGEGDADAPDATTGAVTPVAPGTDAATPAPPTDATADTTANTTTDTATEGPPEALAPDAAAPGGAFRIGVGSYSQSDNAERRAEAFRAEGYPVFTAQQGQYTVVLVGPYESRSEAEAVRARIQSAGLESDPILYELESGADAATASVDTTPEADVTSTSGADDAEVASDAEGSYIQVGAYNSSEQAEPQRERLEQLGFATLLRQDPGSAFVKVWVGPFASERLETVQSQLNELGIENFVPAQ